MNNTINKLLVLCAIIAFFGILYGIFTLMQIIKKKRKKEISSSKVYDYLIGFLIILPVFIFLYILPIAYYDVNFWSVKSVEYLRLQKIIFLLTGVITVFYFLTRVTIFFQHENKYYNIISSLLLLSLIPGISNSLIVIIINEFINGNVEVKYLLVFFVISTYSYIVTIRLSKRKTAYFGAEVAQELNMTILKNIFRFSYRKYEKIKSGKIYTILNDDIKSIFNFSQIIIHIFTNLVTATIVIVYLFTLNLLSSLLLVGSISFIFITYSFLATPLKNAWLAVRSKRENYTSTIVNLVNGFKELVLHKIKRVEYNKDLEKTSYKFYQSQLNATYIDINKTLLSEISFTIAIGISCLLFPLIFNFDKELVTTYVIATLYLWGPFNTIIAGIPSIIHVQISWKRIQNFLSNTDSENKLLLEESVNASINLSRVDKLQVKDVYFNYEGENIDDKTTYGIGPINFEVNQGDIVFIIGGNGSGKTTFLKILIGLYTPKSGEILINGEKIAPKELGEYFSVIYSDFYLFKKIYGINPKRLDQVYEWLEMFGLSDKVQIKDGAYTTIDLSKGQRKRLAILKSYLEDRPIYFFDECAADLDPDFKDFFYNELLKKMRDEGKLLIVITHDDKYFNITDKVYKMDMGKILEVKNEKIV